MAKPSVFVTEKEKTPEWIEEMALSISKDKTIKDSQINQDIICYNYYNNIHNEKDFEYLTKVGERTLPAMLNHIPLQKTLVDTLISEYTIRPFIFSVFASDNDSLKEKQFNRAKVMFKEIESLMNQTIFANQEQIQQIQTQIDMLNQYIQKEPESQDEASKIAQLKESMPSFNMQMKMVLSTLSKQNEELSKEIDEINRKLTYKYKEVKEDLAQKLLVRYYKLYNIKAKATSNFKHQSISGKHYWYIDYFPENKEPVFEEIDPLTVTYPSNSSTEWIQDGPWVKFTKYISYEDLVAKYGNEFIKKYSKEELDGLEELSTSENGTFVSTPEGAMLYDKQPYAGTMQSGIKVDYVFYKSPVKINIKMSPNKYNGDYFRHFIDRYKEIIDRKDYNYRNGEYIKKYDDSVTLKASDVEEYDSRKGQKIRTRYSTDIYKAVVISDQYVLCEGKIYAIVRNPDDYSDVKLPVIGRSYNSITKRPYSLIWSTKGLQDFYNIVYYHRELMLNLAGTKTIVFDRSQKPSTMKDDEWEEQKKLGTMYIQTTDPNGNPIRTSFNQWGMHDLTVPPSIQYLDNMLLNIKETMGEIIGVPRQRLGNTTKTDQVGTFERSLERSMITTEILYYEYDESLAKALSYLLNISTNYIYKDGGVIQYITNDLGNNIVTIPKGVFDNTSFDIYALSNNEDVKRMKELRDILLMGYKDGQIPYYNLVTSFNSESVSELQNKVIYFAEQAKKLNEQAQQANINAQKDLETQKIKLQQEFDGYWKGQEIKLENANLEVAQLKANIDGQYRQAEIALRGKELELKAIELQNEKESEAGVLMMNKYQTDIQARLSSMQTEINALLQLKQMARDKDTEDKDIESKNKKIEVEKIKAKKMVKEHASDL